MTATITDLVASSVLLRFIDEADAAPDRSHELAEAYYWLGKVEARSADSFWVPQAPFHLELAIRLDPRGPHAEDALALYEAQLAFGYGGIESETLPVDLWATLSELRSLVAEISSKELLIADFGQSFPQAGNGNGFFCLNHLVQTSFPGPIRHDPASELINDLYLLILNEVMLVLCKQMAGT